MSRPPHVPLGAVPCFPAEATVLRQISALYRFWRIL